MSIPSAVQIDKDYKICLAYLQNANLLSRREREKLITQLHIAYACILTRVQWWRCVAREIVKEIQQEARQNANEIQRKFQEQEASIKNCILKDHEENVKRVEQEEKEKLISVLLKCLSNEKVVDESSPPECKYCSFCDRLNFEKTGKELMLCSGCMKNWYCDDECQRNDWKNHEPLCKTEAEVLLELFYPKSAEP